MTITGGNAILGGGIRNEPTSSLTVIGSVITGNGSAGGRGGGIFILGGPERVSIHRNTVVHLNHPEDLTVSRDSQR